LAPLGPVRSIAKGVDHVAAYVHPSGIPVVAIAMTWAENQDVFLREPAVRKITRLSRTTRWRLERDGKFPRRRKLSSNAVGWLESEIRESIVTRDVSR
jgi:predicted DNA-binding transcriptional regulator AlpA